ncbi:MAG TPA: hypothetical protein VN841_25045 [Bryobacteraceae bacterium]|nr:hypothetical protein [Bryobacteraceae bacterium]
MPNHILRLVYIGEFLIAVMAILSLWSQVGGQGHLDLMPWYLKMVLTCGLALITVMGTAAAVSHPDGWNAKTIAFVILGLLIACAMGIATYYYHLHENDEDNNEDTKGIAGPLHPVVCNAGVDVCASGKSRAGLETPAGLEIRV